MILKLDGCGAKDGAGIVGEEHDAGTVRLPPSPRKHVNGATVCKSRRFQLPEEFGGVVLSDFGAAVRGGVKRNHDAQPNVYRSPEIMLKAPWSYPVDIWNVGAMVRSARSHTDLR